MKSWEEDKINAENGTIPQVVSHNTVKLQFYNV